MAIQSQQDFLYHIRAFLPDDLELYKGIRLEALLLEAAMYGSTYTRESAFTENEWLVRMAYHNSQCFGLFYADELIGLTGIVVDKADATLGHMVQSYIRKQYRGQGLSRLLYDVRLAWAIDRGLKTLRIGHRESNTASKAANQRNGFIYKFSESCNWPDGGKEDILYYERKI